MADQQNLLDPSIQALVNQANQAPQQNMSPAPANPEAMGLLSYLNQQAAPTPLQQYTSNPQQGDGPLAPHPPMDLKTAQAIPSHADSPNFRHNMAHRDNYADAMKQSVLDQNLGLDQLQTYIKSIQDKPQDINWTPLAAYVDTLGNNSHLADAAKSMAPMTPDEKDKMLFGLQNQLQTGRAQLSKEKLEALQRQMQGQHQAAQEQYMMRMAAAAEKRADNISVGAGIRQDNQTATAVDKATKDTVLLQHSQRINGADRILNQLDAANDGKIVDTNQLLNDLNSEYVNLLRGSQNTALGHLERTEYTTASGNMAGLMQKLTAHPESINSPEILAQLRTSVNELKSNYGRAYDARADVLGRNYVHNPDATQQLHDKLQELKGQFGASAQHTPTTSAPPHGPSVTQNGHTYNWNPATGKYE